MNDNTRPIPSMNLKEWITGTGMALFVICAPGLANMLATWIVGGPA